MSTKVHWITYGAELPDVLGREIMGAFGTSLVAVEQVYDPNSNITRVGYVKVRPGRKNS